MGQFLGGIVSNAVVILPLLGAALWTPMKALLDWYKSRADREDLRDKARAELGSSSAQVLHIRIRDLEQLVDLLRIGHDKGRVRENAIANVAELLIFAIDNDPKPTSAATKLRIRAVAVLAQARSQLDAIEQSALRS